MTSEERIAELLRALPEPPKGWIEAAKQLPAARRELETILERIERDERFRELVIADLEETLRAEGVEPTPVVVAHLRRRLAVVTATTGAGLLASLRTSELHDALAEAGPGPAGGSAAALATMMASGLVRLVARVSPDWEDAPGIAAQAAALGDRSLVLADDDHRVYAAALEQLRTRRPRRDAGRGAPPCRGGAPADRGDRGRRRGARGARGTRRRRRRPRGCLGGRDARRGSSSSQRRVSST